ncbi:MAG TPA: SCO family protein [Candidatus Acidoferrales bacterium]|jgi:protein SCO1/2
MKLRLFFGTLLAFMLFAATVPGVSAQARKNAPDAAPGSSAEAKYRGGMVSPPLPKPKFTLADTSGAPFDFALKTQGYTTLLFFGYTHCPDMCPLQMSIIAQALKQIPPASADRLKVVFVTTDPERDSSQVLRAWLDHFDKRFIGLTGSQAAIDAAQIAANLSPAKKSAVRSDGTYEVGHAAFVLAYTKDNLAHVIYPAGVSEEDWAHDLPLLVTETWSNH